MHGLQTPQKGAPAWRAQCVKMQNAGEGKAGGEVYPPQDSAQQKLGNLQTMRGLHATRQPQKVAAGVGGREHVPTCGTTRGCAREAAGPGREAGRAVHIWGSAQGRQGRGGSHANHGQGCQQSPKRPGQTRGPCGEQPCKPGGGGPDGQGRVCNTGEPGGGGLGAVWTGLSGRARTPLPGALGWPYLLCPAP